MLDGAITVGATCLFCVAVVGDSLADPGGDPGTVGCLNSWFGIAGLGNLKSRFMLPAFALCLDSVLELLSRRWRSTSSVSS